jgi:hypothetical protein
VVHHVTAWVPLSWRGGALSAQAAQFATDQCKGVQCKGVHLGELGGAFVGGVKSQAVGLPVAFNAGSDVVGVW